jgi:4-aminobutyrate aminotransferase
MSVAAPTKRPEIRTELPGPAAREIIKADAQWVTPSYPRPDYKLVVRRAEGVWVVRAIQEQAAELIHMCGTDFYYRHMPELGRKLEEIVPIPGPTKTHFANSGTEAVETALKLAMHATGRQKFIAFFNSFHGRTLGSLSLTSSRIAQRRGFKRSVLDVTHVPYPNAFRHPFTGELSDGATVSRACLSWIEDRLFKTTTPPEEVAGIVVEAVQGEGGYIPAPKEFLDGLRRICDEHGILLIVDEVQSGMGRTGKMFASDHYGLRPDIITIAKGLASGIPIGACVARADLMDWKPGAHASTFGGNPVALASALKTIELLEGGLVRNSAEVGAYLQDGLRALARKHDCIGDVRGLGMMIGVEFVAGSGSRDAAPELRDRVEMECYRRGLILLGAGHNTIRWSPPLILTREHVDVALEIFDEAVSAASKG